MDWKEMPKGQTSLAELVRQFESNCRLEGNLYAVTKRGLTDAEA
jgi:hypothetical protein